MTPTFDHGAAHRICPPMIVGHVRVHPANDMSAIARCLAEAAKNRRFASRMPSYYVGYARNIEAAREWLSKARAIRVTAGAA